MMLHEAMWVGRARVLSFCLLALLVVAAIGVLGARPAHAATFTVNSTTASGAGSLDQAITNANNNNNAPTIDTIKFNIPGTDTGCNATSGVCTINPSSALPEITDPVIVDGYSQPGASPNTLAVGNDAVLKIELSGASIPVGTFANGLEIEADKCTVKGLVISDWENGVFLDTDATGNTVRGNFIGTDARGTEALGNGNDGVRVEEDADNNTIGGTTAAARNIISGNGSDGVEIPYTLPMPPPSPPPDPPEGNRILSNSIYDNDAHAIDLFHSNDPAGVTDNDDGDGDVGPNNLQNYPDLASARTRRGVTTIKGTLDSTADTTFNLQFFSSPAADPSGFGEGKKFLGQKSVTTDMFDNAAFTFKTKKKVPAGQVVTATATNQATGDTSEFSEACTVPGVPCP
jgi:uncharacterized protein (UPF0333 family)